MTNIKVKVPIRPTENTDCIPVFTKVGCGRIWMFAGAVAFIACFQYVYIFVIAPIVGYQGFTYAPPSLIAWSGVSFLALIPVCWLPVRLTRPSQWFYLYLYLTVYVPVCIVPLFRAGNSGRPVEDLVPLWMAMLVCFALLGLVYHVKLLPIRIRPMAPHLFWAGVIGLLTVACVCLYIFYGASLRLAGDALVREQRLQGREIMESSSNSLILGYSMTWTGYALFPFLIAYGVCTRRWWLIPPAWLGSYSYTQQCCKRRVRWSHAGSSYTIPVTETREFRDSMCVGICGRSCSDRKRVYFRRPFSENLAGMGSLAYLWQRRFIDGRILHIFF